MTPAQPEPRGLDLAGAIGACIDSGWRLLLRLLARAGIWTP
jgi:hypothetical protein